MLKEWLNKAGWYIGIPLLALMLIIMNELLALGNADRPPANLDDMIFLGCPTDEVRENVLTGKVRLAYGESTCSLFDGSTVDEVVETGVVTLRLGEWHIEQGTYEADLLQLKIGGKRLYAVWPFDFDEDLLMGDPPALRSGFVPSVTYEVWDSDLQQTTEVKVVTL